MKTQKTLGTIEGKKVVAIYERYGQSSLPKLTIKVSGGYRKTFSGSSLGPINASVAPNASDHDYWRSLAGIAK